MVIGLLTHGRGDVHAAAKLKPDSREPSNLQQKVGSECASGVIHFLVSTGFPFLHLHDHQLAGIPGG